MHPLTVVLLGTVFINLPQYIITGQDAKSNLYQNDGYSFHLKTNNGFQRREIGSFENDVWSVKGSVYWTGPDSSTYGYEYVSNDKGYLQTEFSKINEEEMEGSFHRIDNRTAEGLLGR